jgi:hypothetical protein
VSFKWLSDSYFISSSSSYSNPNLGQGCLFRSQLSYRLVVSYVVFQVVVFLLDDKSSPITHHGGAWRDRRYSSYSFTTSALDGGEWLASRPGRALPPGERTPGTHCTGGWVGPRVGLETEVRGKSPLPLAGIEPRSPGRPVPSQTLYWLSLLYFKLVKRNSGSPQAAAVLHRDLVALPCQMKM